MFLLVLYHSGYLFLELKEKKNGNAHSSCVPLLKIIYQTQGQVFHHDFQRPRNELKKKTRPSRVLLSNLDVFGYLIKHSFKMKGLIERFSIECRKTKTKVITLTNHNSCKQSNEPNRARSKYMSPVPSAGKRVRVSHDWFWF